MENAFSESNHVIEGEYTTGFQEHFYMEPQSALVVPKGEHDEMELFVSTQGLMDVQVKTVVLPSMFGFTCRPNLCRRSQRYENIVVSGESFGSSRGDVAEVASIVVMDYTNSFSAKLKTVVWDYFHIQYFKYSKKAQN